MGKRRKVTAPRWQGSLPPPPVQPSARVAGFTTLADSPERRRQGVLRDLQRAVARPVTWQFDAAVLESAPLVTDALVSTRGSALVRVMGIRGLVNTFIGTEAYSASVVTLPLESAGEVAGVQAAELYGGIPASGPYAIIPFGGEWIVRIVLAASDHSALLFRGQVYDGMGPDMLPILRQGLAESAVESVTISDLLPGWRFGSAANLKRVTLAQSSSTLAGGQPVTILVGATKASFNMLNAGLNVNNPRMAFDVNLESISVLYGGAIGGSCVIAAQLEYQ